jgi:hypothetical protein
MATIFCSYGVDGTINAVFPQSQALNPPTGYVEMPDTDPRWTGHLAAQSKTALLNYASAKQAAVLSGIYSHTLSGSAVTLTTECDPVSISGINSLMAWASNGTMTAATPTQIYVDCDYSQHTITPTQMVEFGGAVGAWVTALWQDLAAVIAGINAGTITTSAQIDAAKWN